MTTTNKNFKVKNGLEVLGTSATVNGNDVLTTASSVDDLVDVSTSGAVEGQALVFDASLNLIPGTVSGGGGGASGVITSDTKPSPATDGLEWHDTTDGNDYISVDGVWVGRAAPASVSSAVDIRLTTAETNITDLEQQVRPVILGGTGATTATDARTNLDAAQTVHVHAASDVTSGQFVHDRLPTGSTLQTVQGVLSTPVTFTTANAWTSVGLSASITPKFSTSKILVSVHIGIGTNAAGDSYDSAFGLFRNGTQIALPAANSQLSSFLPFGVRSFSTYEMTTVSNSYLDSPATTSSMTYDIRAFSTNTNAKYINRTGSDAAGNGDNRMISTITLTEIAG